MESGKKILLLEDEQTDAELALMEIQNTLTEFQYRHVDNKEEFIKELELFNPDVVISDYKLPAFDGMAALKIVLSSKPMVPVIILTGSMNEDTAVECMKAGATDYVIKEHIKRLGGALIHAFEQAQMRKEKLNAEEALTFSEEKYRTIFENVQDVFYQTDLNGIIREVSPSVRYFTEFHREELIGKSVAELYYNSSDRHELLQTLREKGEIRDYEIRLKTSIGKVKYGSINARLVYKAKSTQPDHIDGSIRDITERILSAKSLRMSEEKFRNLFLYHAAPNLIIDSGNLRIVDANLAASRFYGYSMDELKKLKVSDINISKPEVIKEALDRIHTIKEGHFIFQHRTRSNEVKDVEVFSSEIDIDGKSYIHSIIHDITDRKKVEEQIRLLSKSIEQSPVNVVITDPKGNIEYVNQKFIETTKYTFREVQGQNPRVLKSGYHPKEFYENLWKTITSGKEWDGEFQNKKKSGELYWEKASISPLLDDNGRITHFVGIKEDITEKRKILEDLREAKEKAEAGDRLKSAFINNISHEVRTPLNGIMGFSEMLLNPGISESMKAQFSDIIRKSGVRLLSTINNYMDISLIVSENMEVIKRSFHINTLLDDILNEYIKPCQEKGLELTINRPELPDDLQIESDQELFHKLFGHLLNNAVKFTPAGKIEFGFRKVTGFLEFFVRDSGIGIPEDKQNFIFEGFRQGDASMTRGYEGSGLGLTIASGIAKLLGSDLGISSETGKGSTFSFRLPESVIVHSQIVPAKTAGKKTKLHPNPVILVAEDDDFNYKFIEIVLKKEGYIIIRAENGKIAVDLCREHDEVDLILMDMKMPVMGGIEATREIRTFLPKIPIIALTAYVSSQDEYLAFLNGCDEFIPKPVNRVKLLNVVKSYV